MKSLIHLNYSIFFIVVISSLKSQEIGSKGIKGGLSIANVSSDTESLDQAKCRYGFSVGGFISFSISEKLSLKPELCYTQKGYHMDEESDGILYDSKFYINYIEVPLLLKFKAIIDFNFYRIVYELNQNKKTIMITRIRHRRDVYK